MSANLWKPPVDDLEPGFCDFYIVVGCERDGKFSGTFGSYKDLGMARKRREILNRYTRDNMVYFLTPSFDESECEPFVEGEGHEDDEDLYHAYDD